MKTALVTGSQGFIGHHLVEYLINNGYIVIGTDKVYRNWNHQYVECDFTKQRGEFKADIIFHLAAENGGSKFINSPQNDYFILDNNLRIDLNAIKSITDGGSTTKFVYISSSCVNEPTAYGFGKLAGEQLIKSSGIPYIIIRPQNVYGTGETLNGEREKVIPALCRKVIQSKNGIIDIWGNGKQERSFIHVKDFCEQIVKAAETQTNVTLDIGGEYISINSLANKIIKISKKKIKLNHTPGIIGESNKKKLKFPKGKVSFEKGLKEVYEWTKLQL